MNSTLVKPRCAYAHNLLDNSDFRAPVNQRGEPGYVGNVYTIDRWILWSDKGTASLAVEAGGIAINPESSTIYSLAQRFEKGSLKGTAYTLAYCDYAGNIYVSPNPIVSQDAFDYVQITGSAWNKIVWVALYEGTYTADTLPPYQPKGYSTELAACQRYFAAGTFQLAMPYTGIDGVAQNAYICHVVYPVPMRVQPPTVTIKNIKTWVNQSPHATTAVVNIANKDGFNSIWLSEPTNVLLQFDYEASAEL